MSPEEPLPPRLLQLLSEIEDRDFSARLESVFNAATRAIDRLGDVNLLNYEAPVDDNSPDLSLWEEVAPVIRDTVVDVNALLTAIREALLPADELREKNASEALAEQALTEASREISQEITRLGQATRSPSVVSDRWKLLSEVQAFRTKFRTRISRMVKESAGAFAEVTASEIIPGLVEETQAAIELRVVVTDLARVINHRKRKISDAKSADVEMLFRQLRKEIDAFGRTSAYRSLRAQDKRRVIEFRHELKKLEQGGSPSKDNVLRIVEPFAKFVAGLAGVNEREVLVDHDRALRAALAVRVEQVDLAIDYDLPQATRIFVEALNEVRELYGRDPALDQFIRALRKRPDDSFDAAELRQGVEAFRELLANFSVE